MDLDPQASSGIVSFSLRLVVGLLLLTSLLAAQSLQVYSEFQRDPDALPPPREIISPAVARNAFATFRIVVALPANTTYFLFVGVNPPGIVQTRLYKENAAYLEEVRPPGFGVIPAAQSTREYLLDVWVPPDAEPGRRVRIEVQLKTGPWQVYPMELRVQHATMPAIPTPLTGFLARNAAQDLALLLQTTSPEPWLLLFRQTVPVWMGQGPEWVLRLRDILYRSRTF
jgi:hypothetical protein